MCGIAGFAAPDPVPEGKAVLERMNRTQHHRGPDQDGLFLDDAGRVGLAHKRLSIIDLSHGRQPMTDPDGRLTLVFNGEIYNHGDLRAELLAKGHPIRTRSDTETLLFGLKEWGVEGCCRRLRGMFAFAVFDAADGSLSLARDRLGIKPLYWGRRGRDVVFASECKAILAYPGFDRALDLEAASDYFSLLYVPAPKSIFRHVRKLPAGHWMRVSADGDVRSGAYWDLEFPEPSAFGPAELERAEGEVLEALDEAIASHMESDVPLGAFLSGGVDSSAVVAVMARHSRQPINTQTIGFPHPRYDETAQARETAGHFRTEHSEFRVEPDAVKDLERLAWHYDEPFADASMVPTYYVCRESRRKVTVALSGDGGDENFAGYRRYYFDFLENRLRGALPGAVRRPLFGALAAAYPKADWLPRPLRAKTLLRNLSLSPLEGYFNTMSHFLPDMKARLFSGDLLEKLGGYDSLSVFEEHWNRCPAKHPLSRVQYLDFKTYLVDDILTKVDRASMAVSLEVRVPLLDHRFVEFAATVPPEWKLSGKTGKFVLKRALGRILPPSIFARPKSGFNLPIGEWFRGPLREFARESLLGSRGLPATGLFRPGAVESLWSAHQSGLRDHTEPLFALLSFALWHGRFQGAAPPVEP